MLLSAKLYCTPPSMYARSPHRPQFARVVGGTEIIVLPTTIRVGVESSKSNKSPGTILKYTLTTEY